MSSSNQGFPEVSRARGASTDAESKFRSMEGSIQTLKEMMLLVLAISKSRDSLQEGKSAIRPVKSSGPINLSAHSHHHHQPRASQRRIFTPLHQPLSILLPKLLEGKLISLAKPRPLPNPLPRSFKIKESCAYHQGLGHSTDNCITLKHKVQDLIDGGIDIYEPPLVLCSPPPLVLCPPPRPRHPSQPQYCTPVPQCPRNPPARKRIFTPIPYPLSQILPYLLRQGKITLPEPRPLPNPLPATYRKDEFCAYHQQFGHTTNSCFNLKHEVQDLIEAGQLCFKLQLESSNIVEVQRSSVPMHTPFHQEQVHGPQLANQGHQLVAPIISREFQIPSTPDIPMFNSKVGDHKLNAQNEEDLEEIIFTPWVGRAPRHLN